jgi:predicted O-methyltransferase YrrM
MTDEHELLKLLKRLTNPADWRKALTSPRKTLRYAHNQIAGDNYAPPSELFNDSEYHTYYSEIKLSGLWEDLQSELQSEFVNLTGRSRRGYEYTPGVIDQEGSFSLYALVRCQRPDRVVETGVCNGMSTAFVLAALSHEGCGQLISIDYPEIAQTEDQIFESIYKPGGAVIPPNRTSGWIVPNRLHSRWELKVGLSRELLPEVVREDEKVDIFIHDSEHSYETMWFEYETVWPHLSEGGLLVSDDTSFSNAFHEFADQHDCRIYRLTGDLLMIQK